MIKKALVAGVLLSMFSGLAHSEGNYSNMNFGFLIYALVAVIILAAQGLYTLCIGGVSLGKRFVWVLALFTVDALIAAMMISSASSALETPGPYIFWVLPGFLLVWVFKTSAADAIPPGEQQ